jgi:hypothetical protein
MRLSYIWLEFQFWLQDRWDDLTSPIESRWWRFRQWRRSRNPELVELDAFRELVEVEDRLERYPNAVPLLESALKLYEITGQKKKVKEFQKRLSKDRDLLL